VDPNIRQALVIGNSEYRHAGRLRNPMNDARAIGSTLQQLGFEVTTLVDADQRKMERAIRDFGDELRNRRGVGLFYYAGHGMQFDGENYLLPTDINPSTEDDVRYDAVPLGKMLAQMEVAGNGMNIVILDACRNNPFSRSFRSSSQGLAQVVAPTGSFISYATAPGKVAADGEGENGLFTEMLLKHITTPSLSLEKFFKRVRADVQKESDNKQVPWDSSSVTGDFFFVQSGTPLPSEGLKQSISTNQKFKKEKEFLLDGKQSIYMGKSLISGEGDGFSLGYTHSIGVGFYSYGYENIHRSSIGRQLEKDERGRYVPTNYVDAYGDARGYLITYRTSLFDNYFLFGYGVILGDIQHSYGTTRVEDGTTMLVGYEQPVNNSFSILFNVIRADFIIAEPDSFYNFDDNKFGQTFSHIAGSYDF
jgi:hypothetical protein